MLQQRKKDYLQCLIEEFFKKLELLINKDTVVSNEEQKTILNDCFEFFFTNFEIIREDSVDQIVDKINENDLMEQYAKLLMMEYDIIGNSDRNELLKALAIVDYTQNTDTTYSWERVVLREDILHRLDEENNTES